ncbi:hypothetical protein M419DRAFT_124918 [Trichoderma reesei RUT C-30]|uniref:Uncharacterized protein n=1 Tax=Hypocrea jecorina (strain ATCC 56765 / BCRC 32924 / NRRL 11460 / Rut C-30) TaxID=1344414 RepID=A0A024S1T1_HYPJR|nr:hypothetical protein M419DRAFT_124918 [Trichoderma reesei RUT C-30]
MEETRLVGRKRHTNEPLEGRQMMMLVSMLGRRRNDAMMPRLRRGQGAGEESRIQSINRDESWLMLRGE